MNTAENPRPPLPPFDVDVAGNWSRSDGVKNWEFDEHGHMRRRIASIKDLPIAASDRKFHWPLGPRPDDYPSLPGLGL